MKKQSKTLSERLKNSINNEVLTIFNLKDWEIVNILVICNYDKD